MASAAQPSSIILLDPAPKGFGKKPDQLEADFFVSELPVQHSHSFYEDETLGLYVGLWDTTDMIEAAGPYTCDEFMLLLEGEARIKNNQSGEITTITAGQAFVLPKGYDCQWQQQGYLRKFYLISEHPNEPVPAQAAKQQAIIIPSLADGGASNESALFPGMDLEKGRELILYSDCKRRFFAGVWQSAELASQSVILEHHCLLCVSAGDIQFVSASGERDSISSGQSCFIPTNTEFEMSVSVEAAIQFCVLKP